MGNFIIFCLSSCGETSTERDKHTYQDYIDYINLMNIVYPDGYHLKDGWYSYYIYSNINLDNNVNRIDNIELVGDFKFENNDYKGSLSSFEMSKNFCEVDESTSFIVTKKETSKFDGTTYYLEKSTNEYSVGDSFVKKSFETDKITKVNYSLNLPTDFMEYKSYNEMLEDGRISSINVRLCDDINEISIVQQEKNQYLTKYYYENIEFSRKYEVFKYNLNITYDYDESNDFVVENGLKDYKSFAVFKVVDTKEIAIDTKADDVYDVGYSTLNINLQSLRRS